MQIFFRGTRLFMYLVTNDAFDPAHDFARINADPTSQRWNALMADLQERVPEANPDEWWAPMELVFDMDWPQGPHELVVGPPNGLARIRADQPQLP